MEEALIATLLFVVNMICSMFASLVLMRFFLQWVKADFYNPLCQFVMKFTNPLLLPLRRIIPGFFGLDWAAIALVFLTLALNLALIFLFQGPVPSYVFVITLLVHFADLVLNLYFVIILIRAFMSFSPYALANPIFIAFLQLTEPVLRPIRRMIKPIHGFDLSPLIVIILIQAILFFMHKALGM